MATPMMPPNVGEPPPELPNTDPTAGQSEERTHDAPKPAEGTGSDNKPAAPEVPEDVRKGLIEIITKYSEKWLPVRRRRIRQILRAREYVKGNQYISFDANQFLWYDPLEAVFDGNSEEEDLGIYRYVNNVYQMLLFSFVASLSPQVPRSRFMPLNAEKEEDVATAKAGSTVQEVVERQNKIKSMQRLELMYFWTDGAYFKYTRFIVDGNRAGTHKEPQFALQDIEAFPDRFTCPNCDHDTPAQSAAMLAAPMCEACGSPLDEANFYPADHVQAPVLTEYKDVPNGMVAQSVYGLLNVQIAPYAATPSDSPMLKLDEEVDIASVRTSYPDAWDMVKSSTANTGEDEAERLSRQVVLNSAGGRNNFTSEMMPTLSRSWLQDWSYAILDDQVLVRKIKGLFPDGALVVHIGQDFLEARKEKLGEKWTGAVTMPGHGQQPPAAGEAALDLQDQINDTANIIQEHADRNASPETYVDEGMIDTRQLNGKPTLPGTIVGIKRKLEEMSRPLADFMFQRKVQIDENLYERPMKLFEFAQLLTGVMPQTFGEGQQHIDTLGGQQQALNVALGRLGIYWEAIREEHAEAAELAVRCAANNYTEDIMDVVGGGGEDYRNRYVRLSDLSGEFHAYVDTDQGFPAGFAEIRDRLQQLFMNAAKNPWAAAMLEDPVNQKLVATYIGPPGMVIPGDATRSKVMRVINKLVEMKPSQQVLPDPATGKPMTVMIPSIMPDQDFDDFDVVEKVTKLWGVENWEMQYENPIAYENVRAYYKMAVQLGEMKAMKAAAMAAPTEGAPQ